MKEDLKAEAKVLLKMAENKKPGSVPGNLKKKIIEFIYPKVDWTHYLREWFSEVAYADWNWRKPDPVLSDFDEYLMPSIESEEIGSIGMIIDSSGSTWPFITEFVSEVSGLLETFNLDKLITLYVDTMVRHIEEWTSNEEFQPRPFGGGRTRFEPGFEWLREREHELVGIIYLTDGYCSSFPSFEPSVPVLWVLPKWGNAYFKPPFGDVIRIEQ